MFFRPMNFGEMIDSTFRSLRKTFWPLWWFFFLFNVPLELFFIYWEYFSNNSSNVELILFIAFLIIFLFLLTPIFQNVCINVVIDQLKGEEKKFTLKFLFSIAFDGFGKLFLANALIIISLLLLAVIIILLVGLPVYLFAGSVSLMDQLVTILIVGGLIWTIPASFLGIRLSLTLPILAIEMVSIRAAFARSWLLTKHSYASLTGKWILLFVFQTPFYFLGVYLLEMLEHATFFYDIVFLLLDPIFVAMIYVFSSFLYIDQRTKKEAFDLQLGLEKKEVSPH